MELLSPAGNLEKLKYAYAYGADAAYIGIGSLSLRARADNFSADDVPLIRAVKGDKKLYAAVNKYFMNDGLARVEKEFDLVRQFPIDAFIISDIGLISLFRKHFPQTPLHLSTQANCTNAEAAKIYGDLGFERIILGREVPLKDIEEIKRVSGLEIETFVHGAMCLAYSGRCFISRWMADRSGNEGDCAHACRWQYRLKESGDLYLDMEESQRPGEYYSILEGDDFTTILSSRDLCMIDHLAELRNAGVDSLKIEGRMKSLYYTAVVTRAYRKHIDALETGVTTGLEAWRDELFHVSHREFSTGFFFGKENIESPTELSYQRDYLFLGTLGDRHPDGGYDIDVKNTFRCGEPVEYISPDVVSVIDSGFRIVDAQTGEERSQADHGKAYRFFPGTEIGPDAIIRKGI